MSFDVRTLFLANGIIGIINVLSILFIWINYKMRYKGLLTWGIGLFFYFLGNVMIMSRGYVPDIVSFMLANIAIVMSYQILVYGMSKFYQLKYEWFPHLFLMVLYASLFYYFYYVSPNLNVRNGLIAVTGMILFGEILYKQSKTNFYYRKFSRFLVIVDVIFLITNVIRMIQVIFFPVVYQDLFQNHFMDIVSTMISTFFTVILPLGLIITVNERTLEDIKSEESKFTNAFYNSPTIMLLTHLETGLIQDVNDAFTDTFMYTKEEAIGKTTLELNIWGIDAERDNALKVLGDKGFLPPTEHTFYKRDGSKVDTIYSMKKVMMMGEPYLLTTASDTTLLGIARNELYYFATHDNLTQLLNRHELHTRFNEYTKNEDNEPFGVVMMDLDRFKSVNDTHGHDFGDEVLKTIAKKIEYIFKEYACYRFGGDEFVVLIKPIKQDAELVKYTIKVKNEIEQLKLIGDKKIDIGISVGFGIYPRDGKTLESLIQFSDKLMYQDKRS